MQMSHWNPFREMEDLLARFNRPLTVSADPDRMPLSNWAPTVDISETEKEYLIRAELAGLKKEEVQITVQNGVLTLAGERKAEKQDKAEKYHRVERTYGRFTRSFSLPEDTSPERITAECKDGVLTIHVAKSEVPKPKSIEVKVA